VVALVECSEQVKHGVCLFAVTDGQ
jgi:hypothetical protein